jgi:nucleosome binding factor SPN SPT16 subunit
MYDPDEIEEEQRERERRNKINAEFGQFVKKVQELWEKDLPDMGLEFDIPFRSARAVCVFRWDLSATICCLNTSEGLAG